LGFATDAQTFNVLRECFAWGLPQMHRFLMYCMSALLGVCHRCTDF
jgi:hypothetical protein